MFKDSNQFLAQHDLLSTISNELLAQSSFVILVGSFAEGLATSTSDIDIYVCCEQEFVGELYSRENVSEVGRNIQISILSNDYIGRVVSRAAQDTYSGFPIREVEIIHKIINGKVLSGGKSFDEIISPGLRLTLPGKISEYFNGFLKNHYDDLLGASQEDDRASASFFLRSLVDNAVDAWLAINNDTYPKRKWRIKRAKKKLPVNLYLEYMSVIFGNPFSGEYAYDKYLAHSLLFCRELCFHANYPRAESSTENLSSDEIYTADPWVFTYRLNNVVYIKIKNKEYKANELSRMIVLYLFEPRGVSSILSMVCGSGNYDAQTTVKTINNLKAIGAINPLCEGSFNGSSRNSESTETITPICDDVCASKHI